MELIDPDASFQNDHESDKNFRHKAYEHDEN